MLKLLFHRIARLFMCFCDVIFFLSLRGSSATLGQSRYDSRGIAKLISSLNNLIRHHLPLLAAFSSNIN